MTDENEGQPHVTKMPLKRGEPTVIRFNRPVKFRIELAGGSTIEGVIPANVGLDVCNHGDITGFEITIDKDSMPKLEPVED